MKVVVWPDTPCGCAPFVMQVGGLLENVLPTWSLHTVFFSMATSTQRCGKGRCTGCVCVGMESGVAEMCPGNRKVHEHGWPDSMLLPGCTDCPSECVPVKGWCSSTELRPPHTTSTSRCACAATSGFIKGILHASMSSIVRFSEIQN